MKFWEEHIIIDFHYSSSSIGFFLESHSDIEDEGITPERCITIYPKNNEETELHNRWLYNLILRDKENKHCDFEFLKAKYFEAVNNNPLPFEFTELEIEAIKKQRDKEKTKMEQNQSMTFWGYYFGYQSVVKNKEYYVEVSADKFKRIALSYAKGVADAHYLGFLETQLEKLKHGKSILPEKNKKENKTENKKYSQRQIAIAYCIMGKLITSENAAKILSKHSDTRSTVKLLAKRINNASNLALLTGNKTSDTKSKNDLYAAKRLISGMKNTKAVTDISRIITAFEIAYKNNY
ncbi:MAG: hypothetical protein ACLQQ4_10430 [Bacteroidia bacterium]